MIDGYQEQVKAAILDEGFVRATFSGRRPGQDVPWIKVTLRPVLLKGQMRLQVAYYDERTCITKNVAPADAAARLDELLAQGFKNINAETTMESLSVQLSKSGKALMHRGAPSNGGRALNLSHNREKARLLPEGRPDAFLQAVGIMTAEGAVRADRQRKFRQINEFLSVIDQTLRQAGSDGHTPDAPVSVVDCGCGNAYLTFAAYHYFHHLRDTPARLVGIDVNAALIAAHEATARELGWTDLSFEATPILEYAPATPPEMVLALHACDTATDDALARAIAWGSRIILSVPCCQHHLQKQLAQPGVAPPLRPILRHGVLRERLGDVLTDAFRALILRIMGYQTDVMEFVSTEHTAKNVMIRAVRATRPGERAFVQEYRALKEAYGVTPYLEERLGEHLTTLLNDMPTYSRDTTPC